MLLSSRLLFLLVVLFNLAYNAALPLHPDEAYYWVWSRNLELSYYDHPPMVAYMIWLIKLLGESESAIRLSAVLAMSGAAWFVFKTGSLLFGREVGETGLIVYLLIPMTHIGFLAVTPDPFLSLFWSLTLYLVCRGLFTKRRVFLALSGITIGCAMLSKYTGVLLPAALLLCMAATPRLHPQLVSKHLLAAVFFAFMVFSPVLIWNWQYDWLSFSYQFGHGVADEKVFNPTTILEFVFGQAAISNPFLFFPICIYLLKTPFKNLREPRLAVLVWPFVFTLLFLGYNAIYKKSELNWAMPAMISGSVLLGYWLKAKSKRVLFIGAGVFLLLAIILFKVPEIVPGLPGKLVMKNNFFGNDQIFSGVSIKADEFVLSDHYETASIAAYYLPGRPAVYILESSPVSQYSFWRNRLINQTGRNAIWIGEGEPSVEVMAAFSRVSHIDTLFYSNRFVTKRYDVYRCEKYNGWLP